MRIVAGHLKGRSISAPKGKATRPTSDRARETLFNVLGHADWSPSLAGARVIDLFAGSGALGFEAMSRGGAFGLFVETNAAARATIRLNIEAFGLTDSAQLYRRGAVDLGRRPAGLGAPFDLVFLDPPYNQGLVAPCLTVLTDGNWMTDDALAVVETAANETVDKAGWNIVHERAVGAAKFWFLERSV